jgi:hypothetical protein
MSTSTRLYIITGVPRSGTTWLHDSLIRHGIFRGEIGPVAESEPVTNECRFAMDIRYPNRAVDKMREIVDKWGVDGRCMVKGPQYVFNLPALCGAFDVRVIWCDRDAGSIARSMASHPFFVGQLSRPPMQCDDFGREALMYSRDCVRMRMGSMWATMTIEERADFKIHYFARCWKLYHHGLAPSCVVDYNAPDWGALSSFVGVDCRMVDTDYNPTAMAEGVTS